MKHSFGQISDVIEAWCLSFVPEETFIGLIPDIPSSCLVIPKQEFFNHPLYRRPDNTNPYVTWQMDQDVTYVIHAFSSFLKELQEHVKTRLLEFQVTAHLRMNSTSKYVILFCSTMGRSGIAGRRETCDDSIALHLADYTNRFPIQDGSDCLAATLFAVTGNEQVVHQ